jgi:hypothetical protein
MHVAAQNAKTFAMFDIRHILIPFDERGNYLTSAKAIQPQYPSNRHTEYTE